MDQSGSPTTSASSTSSSTHATEKILVRNLKKVHFDRTRLPAAPALLAVAAAIFTADVAGYEELRREFAAPELDLDR
jgi:hypothetical protein